jgi:hypothetical protein
MIAQPFGRGNASLGRIRAGMGVVDAADAPIGTVRRVHQGGRGLPEATLARDPVLDDLPDGPEALRERLVASGFVVIAAGDGRADRLAPAEQVAEVGDDHIRLAVGWDTLPHA